MQEPTIRFVIPSVVSSHFHIRDGDIVADFGAGVGNFIPELSKRAGPDGRVYACEIQKNLIFQIRKIIKQVIKSQKNKDHMTSTESQFRFKVFGYMEMMNVSMYLKTPNVRW